MKKLIIFICVLIFSSTAFAANHYVLEGGSGDGSAWNNAFPTLPATLIRGDTYYIGDGNYVGYVFDDADSGTDVITIKKATAADHGTETGWNAAYGDGQALFRYTAVDSAAKKATLNMKANYITIDGNVSDCGFDDTCYGIKIKYSEDFGLPDNNPSYRSGIYGIGLPTIEMTNRTINNVKIYRTAVEGAGEVNCINAIPYTCYNSGIAGNSLNASDIEIAYNYVFKWTQQIGLYKHSDVLIHHNYFYLNSSQSVGAHGQQISVDGTDNIDMYANHFKDSKTFALGAHGNGGSNTNFTAYNNIIEGHVGSGLTACLGTAGSGASNVFVGGLFYNNTFYNVNCGGNGAIFVGTLTDVDTQKSYAYNNLFYLVAYPRMDNSTFTAGGIVHNYNAYLNCTGTINSDDEANPQRDDAALNPFTSATDFTPKAGTLPVNNGNDALVNAVVTEDYNGLARPVGAEIDIGALELDSAGGISGQIVADNMTESTMVTGGATIDFTIVNDTLVADDGTFAAQRQNVIDNCISAVSAVTEPAGWIAEILADEVVTAITRESDTLMRWTLSANAAFAISDSDGPITCTIPHEILVTAIANVIATPAPTIYNEDPAEIYPTTGVGYSATGQGVGYSTTGQAVGLPAVAP